MAQYDREVPYPEGPDQINAYPALSQELAAAINALTPVGTIIQCVSQPQAGGWILCDGAMYSRSDLGSELYVALYQYWLVGGVVVPNSDPMPVPDLRGRVVIGAGTDEHASNNIDRPIGRRGGDTRYQSHNHTVNDNRTAASPRPQPDGSTQYEGIPMVANTTAGDSTARGAHAINNATANPDPINRWTAHAYDEPTRGMTGASGNLPPYAVIPSFIYAGKPSPFTRVGDIKDTYPVPSVSPATTLDIREGEVPPPTDLEHNPPPGYWEADNGEG